MSSTTFPFGLPPWQPPPPPVVNQGSAAAAASGGNGAVDAAAGCCVSHVMPYMSHDVTDKKTRNARQCDLVWEKFTTYLQTPDFVDFCRFEGILDPSIVLCEKTTSPLWDAFCAQLEKDSSSSKASVQLGIVFHGTAQGNIAAILKTGLDPKLRCGQSFGVGEYFSKNPSTSLCYCKGGNQMLVYCVVIASATSSTHNVHKPQDFVVVAQPQHQVPMAVLEFSGASAAAANRSQQIRFQLQSLNRLVQQADAAAKEAENKAKIVQLLIRNELQGAAHKFRTEYATFSHNTKLEISYWAHVHADAEVVRYYFNGSETSTGDDNECYEYEDNLLPPPPDWNTFQHDIVSVEKQQKRLDRAWLDVKECQKKPKAEVDSNNNSSISMNNTITAAAAAKALALLASSSNSSSIFGSSSLWTGSPSTILAQNMAVMAGSNTHHGRLAPLGLLQSDKGAPTLEQEAAAAAGMPLKRSTTPVRLDNNTSSTTTNDPLRDAVPLLAADDANNKPRAAAAVDKAEGEDDDDDN